MDQYITEQFKLRSTINHISDFKSSEERNYSYEKINGILDTITDGTIFPVNQIPNEQTFVRGRIVTQKHTQLHKLGYLSTNGQILPLKLKVA